MPLLTIACTPHHSLTLSRKWMNEHDSPRTTRDQDNTMPTMPCADYCSRCSPSRRKERNTFRYRTLKRQDEDPLPFENMLLQKRSKLSVDDATVKFLVSDSACLRDVKPQLIWTKCDNNNSNWHGGSDDMDSNRLEAMYHDGCFDSTDHTLRSFDCFAHTESISMGESERHRLPSTAANITTDSFISRFGDVKLYSTTLTSSSSLSSVPSLRLPSSSSSHTTSQTEITEEEEEQRRTLLLLPRDKYGNTELHIKINEKDENGALEIIRKATDFDDLSVANKFGQTALHLAVATNQGEILRKLMAAGGSVSAIDNDGNTALHVAAANGRTDLVQQLLTPIKYEETIENRYTIPLQTIPQNLLEENEDGLDSLDLACVHGHRAVLSLLIEYLDLMNIDSNIITIKCEKLLTLGVTEMLLSSSPDANESPTPPPPPCFSCSSSSCSCSPSCSSCSSCSSESESESEPES